MFTTKFIQRVWLLAIVVILIGGLGLVPFYARDIVEYFVASTSASATQTDFYPAPIVRAP